MTWESTEYTVLTHIGVWVKTKINILDIIIIHNDNKLDRGCQITLNDTNFDFNICRQRSQLYQFSLFHAFVQIIFIS